MHLIYMESVPIFVYRWGYKEDKDDIAIAEGLGIIAEQGDDETRDEFFERVGDRPAKDMYGSDEKKDSFVISDDYRVREAVVKQGYGLDKLAHDDEWIVRCGVVKKGYKLSYMLEKETHKTVSKNNYRNNVRA